jgi:hypothetical protein
VKPLSKARREAALTIARRDQRLRPLLSGRNRPVFVEPNLHDPKRPDAADIVIGLYDYRSSRSVLALVDPSEERVIGVEETDAQFQLSDEEQREAENLAGNDTRVRDFLRDRSANPLTRLYFPPAAAGEEAAHRYAIVFLRPTTSERLYAVVDLSARKVVEILDSLVG